MAGAALNILGIGLTGLMMIPFLDSLIPKDPPTDITTVRIGVGKSPQDEKFANFGGNRPGIRLFDVIGNDLGKADGNKKKTIQAGDYYDYNIKMPSGNRGQAEYISISQGGNDAICIAYVSVTWPDGGKRAWYGDIVQECGGYWYYSHTIAGDGDYKPMCGWLDGDGSNGLDTKGFGIHLTDFTVTQERVDQWNNRKDLLCKSQPRFYMYKELTTDHFLPVFDPPLDFEAVTLTDKDPKKVLVDGVSKGNAPPKNKKRGLTRRNKAPVMMKGQLVTSKDPNQSATKLCKSDTSAGADFVSYKENLFCDMESKELWPLCGKDANSGPQQACFDVEKWTMRPGNGLRGRDLLSGRSVPAKEYHSVSHWE